MLRCQVRRRSYGTNRLESRLLSLPGMSLIPTFLLHMFSAYVPRQLVEYSIQTNFCDDLFFNWAVAQVCLHVERYVSVRIRRVGKLGDRLLHSVIRVAGSSSMKPVLLASWQG